MRALRRGVRRVREKGRAVSERMGKVHRRDIRRVFGADAMDSYVSLMRRVTALEDVLMQRGVRGLVARCRWLLFGLRG